MAANKYFNEKGLLKAPAERAAYSDRQAYVCAELAKLAYFKFEGGDRFDEIKSFVEEMVSSKSEAHLLLEALKPVIADAPDSGSEAEKILDKILDAAGFKLVATINYEGTQAFICYRDLELASHSDVRKRQAYLVFRGTEPTSLADIKTDLKANLTPVKLSDGSSLGFHSGFYEAFAGVQKQLEVELLGLKYDQLFITGHSLGGALAVVATRLIKGEIKGACYTFGAPPIGVISIQNGLKTPVYQIRNEADIVPSLPNPWLAWGVKYLLLAIITLARPFAGTFDLVFSADSQKNMMKWLGDMTEYAHPGYQSYLVGSGRAARLRFHLSFWRRMALGFKSFSKNRFGFFKKSLSDHSIDLYVTKLAAQAKARNQKT